MNESKWRKFILGEAVDVKVKDLTFDMVQDTFKDKYQNIHFTREQPNGEEGPAYKDYVSFEKVDNLQGIIDAKALEQWKEEILSIKGIDPNVKVTLDPDSDAWFNKAKIKDPAFVAAKNRMDKAAQSFYDKAKIDRKTGGRYTGD